MDYMSAILNMARTRNGFVTATEVTQAGIPRRCLTQAVESGTLLKAERGLYMLPDTWDDEFLILQHRFKKGVFSHETSLFLHGLTDRTPAEFTMTFPHGYNAKRAQEAGVVVRKSIEKHYELGICLVRTPYGNEIRAYDVERTLCDIVRGEGSSDVQLVNPAMKAYSSSREKNVNKLLQYASTLGSERKIRAYMEVLL